MRGSRRCAGTAAEWTSWQRTEQFGRSRSSSRTISWSRAPRAWKEKPHAATGRTLLLDVSDAAVRKIKLISPWPQTAAVCAIVRICMCERSAERNCSWDAHCRHRNKCIVCPSGFGDEKPGQEAQTRCDDSKYGET
jgi:hypothetical protein